MAEKTRPLAEMDAAHRRVGRYVSIALIVGEAQHWLYLRTIMAGLLLPRERAALAFSVMASLDPDQRSMVSHATAQRAVLGPPLATLADVRDDAEWWSRNASIQERKIYLMACLNRLSEVDRRDLTNHLTGRAAA
ncbi:hypothetical protein N9413_12135 [Paracoccaceae bacterium]|nr:hypothetical protein [Paracoccaceae bacterium]